MMSDKLVELGPFTFSEKVLNEKGYYLRESKQAGRFKPEDGNPYWFMFSDGEIIREQWSQTNMDKRLYAMGNCYRTEAEATAARDTQLALVRVQDRLEELTDEPLNWSLSLQNKYVLFYCWQDGDFNAYSVTRSQCVGGLYGSESACEWVIDNMKSDLKLIAGIV